MSDNTPEINIIRKNGIEIYQINSDVMGSHAVHWDALTNNPEKDVVQWLSDMIDNAIVPIGLEEPNEDNNANERLVIATEQDVHVCQMYQLDEGRPSELITAFPSVNSPYGCQAKISRIIENTETYEAVLRLETADGTTLYAYDALYALNHNHYDAVSTYEVALSGICHTLELFTEDETLTITDEDAIKHHRALNSILEANNGEVPDDLQEQIDAWKPSSDTDLLPVEINLGKMCAYLFGEHTGQEDEAWCQAEIIGLQKVTLLNTELQLLDIVVLKEQDAQPVVVRVACTQENSPENLKVGDFIRTNVWLQAKICAKNTTN